MLCTSSASVQLVCGQCNSPFLLGLREWKPSATANFKNVSSCRSAPLSSSVSHARPGIVNFELDASSSSLERVLDVSVALEGAEEAFFLH